MDRYTVQKRHAERRPALAPARLVIKGEGPASGQELVGDVVDISLGGAAMEISDVDNPLMKILRQHDLKGELHVLMPDGNQVITIPAETVWVVEHIFGAINRMIVGLRNDGTEAARQASAALIASLPEQMEDTTIS